MKNMKEIATKAGIDLVERIQKAHSDKFKCSTWETWTENVLLIGGGRATLTFDGCRVHRISVTRDKE